MGLGGDANQNLYLKPAHPIALYLLSETFFNLNKSHIKSKQITQQIRLLINQAFMKEYSPPCTLRKQRHHSPYVWRVHRPKPLGLEFEFIHRPLGLELGVYILNCEDNDKSSMSGAYLELFSQPKCTYSDSLIFLSGSGVPLMDPLAHWDQRLTACIYSSCVQAHIFPDEHYGQSHYRQSPTHGPFSKLRLEANLEI